ncbi:MAG: putative ABC transporter permease [Oscillospiraceae bacterium]
MSNIFSVDLALYINVFFLYSFMGWIMECIVIRHEKGFWENRGFVHGPFCIIYGFGAMLGYMMLKPFSFNWVLLFITSACIATAFEYLTARLMIKAFGNLWWDYKDKPLNYKGILCLESTLGWGVIGILLFAGMHSTMFYIAGLLPQNIANATAFILICGYVCDFVLSMRNAAQKNQYEDVSTFEEKSV